MDIDNVWLLVLLGLASWAAYAFGVKKPSAPPPVEEKKPLPPPPATAPSDSERDAILARAQPWLEQVVTKQLPAMWRTELHIRLDKAKQDVARSQKDTRELQDKLATATDGSGPDSREKIQSRIDSEKDWEKRYVRTVAELQQQVDKDEQPKEEVALAKSVREDKNDVALTCRNVLKALLQLRLRAGKLLELENVEHRKELDDLLRDGSELLPRLVPAVTKEGLVVGNVLQMLTEVGAWHLVPVCLAAEEHVAPEWKGWARFEYGRDEHIFEAKSKVNDKISELYPYLCREAFTLKSFPSIAAIQKDVEGVFPMLVPQMNLSLVELIAVGLDPNLPKDRWSTSGEVLKQARVTAAKFRAADANAPATALPLLFATPGDLRVEIRDRAHAVQNDDFQEASEQTHAAIAREAEAVRAEVERLRKEVEPALTAAFTEMTTTIAAATTYEAKCVAVEKYRSVEEKLLQPVTFPLNSAAVRRLSKGKEDYEARITEVANRLAFALILLEKYQAHTKQVQPLDEFKLDSSWVEMQTMVAASVNAVEAANKPLPPAPASAPSKAEREAILDRAQPWLEQTVTKLLPAMWRTELRLRLIAAQEDVKRCEANVRELESKLANPDTESEFREKLPSRIEDSKDWQARYAKNCIEYQEKLDKDEQPKEEVPIAKSICEEKGDIAATCRNVLRTLVQLRVRASTLLGLKTVEHRTEAIERAREGLALLPRLVPAVPKEGLIVGNVLPMLTQIGAWHLVPVCLAAEEHVKPLWTKPKHIRHIREEQFVQDAIYKAMRENSYKNEPQEMYPLLERCYWTLNDTNIANMFKDEDWSHEHPLVDTNQTLVELLSLGIEATRLGNKFHRDGETSPIDAARLLAKEWAAVPDASKLSEATARATQIWSIRYILKDLLDNASAKGLNIAANIARAAGASSLAKVLNVGSSVAAATGSSGVEGFTVATVDAAIRTEVERLRKEVEPALSAAFAEMTTTLAAARTYDAKCAAVEKYHTVEEKLLKLDAFRLSPVTIREWEDDSKRVVAYCDKLAQRIAFLFALLDKYETQQKQ